MMEFIGKMNQTRVVDQ